MATLNGFCPKCEKPIEAFVAAEDLRRVGDEGFAAAPALRKQGAEDAEKQLRECEESLRSLEQQHAQFREQMLEPLKDEGRSIESLSWDELLGVAVRNANEAMRAADERDQALAKGAEEGKRRAREIAAERLADLWKEGAISESHRWYVLNAMDEKADDA